MGLDPGSSNCDNNKDNNNDDKLITRFDPSVDDLKFLSFFVGVTMDGDRLRVVEVFAIGGVLVFIVSAVVSYLLWFGVEVFAIGGVLVFVVLAMVSSLLWFGFGIMRFVLVVHNNENTNNQQTVTSFTYLLKKVEIIIRCNLTSSMSENSINSNVCN